MFRGLSKLFLSPVLLVFLVIAIEQLCFRFSEAYATWRTDWIWKHNDSAGKMAGVFSLLPLSQLAEPPSGDLNASNERLARDESLYAKKILDYMRPLRDELYDSSLRQNSLRDFEVRRVGQIHDLALPVLSEPATTQDVKDGLARREGEAVSSSKAALLFVFPPKHEMSESEFRAQRLKLESKFISFLKRGIACGIIHVDSAEQLNEAVLFLRQNEKKLAPVVLAWGSGESAGILSEAVTLSPNLYQAVVFESPKAKNFASVETQFESPWVLGLQYLGVSGLDRDLTMKMIAWVRAGRENSHPKSARLGGLLHVSSGFSNLRDKGQTFGEAYFLECAKRIPQETVDQAMEEWSVTPELEDKENPAGADQDKLALGLIEEKSANQLPATLGKNIVDLDLPIATSSPSASYDCQLLRDYRSEKPESRNVENKELILQLGRMFEKKGVLGEIGKRDEFFVLYYRSLKALDK